MAAEGAAVAVAAAASPRAWIVAGGRGASGVRMVGVASSASFGRHLFFFAKENSWLGSEGVAAGVAAEGAAVAVAAAASPPVPRSGG